MYNSGHHHHHHKQGAPVSPDSAAAADIFEQLCTASTFKSVLYHYRLLCDVLRLKPTNFRNFYPKLKSKLRSWKAQAIWSKFDKRSSHKCYNHGKACTNSKVLIIGAGPCGLRTAIEAQLLGAKVVVVEKRDRFSRNNVLHLWPFVINDLKQLGAKKFYGKFCAGAIDHISIRQLQCILLKVALLLGVEIYENVSFEELTEPPEDQNEKIGWRARLSPPDHPANQYEFDVLIGADGKRNTLHGFKRKEFRGKLAIAITANFINKRTELEARVQEISGVAFIFNQKFFKELYAATGIDLENIVYYKDETHYFVMTAKKQSLIEKGVILRDLQDTQQLLHPSNVDRNALMEYAREAADFSTSYQLPHLDFAVNHYGKPDVAMFDFTSMFAAENACRMVERRGHKLLSGLVGDSLLEPFWPTGSGCARGFLSSFDACWMIRSFSSGKMMPLEVLAERESIYRLLAQTTPENLSKDHSSYSLDPASRYPTINLRAVLPFQVRSLFNTDDPVHLEEITNPHLVNNDELPKKRKRRVKDSFIHPDTLLIWCKKQVALYDSVSIDNMTTSFKDGRALCAIIHRYRPDLIDFEALRPEDIAQNNQLAYDILERDFGIPPVMTGREMAECEIPDKLSMISYVSQIYDVFRGEIPHIKHPKMDDGEMEIEQSHIQHSTPHVNILKNLTNKTANVSQGTPTSKKRSTLERGTAKRDDGRITCRLVEDAGGQGGKSDTLKKTKKRRSDRVVSPQERQGREEHQRKPLVDHKEEFSDKVRDLEAKFTANSSSQASDKKPKDLIRAIGKIEKSDWNMVAIEKKMHEDRFGMEVQKERERVPKWNRDAYDDKADKFQNIERRLRENGEDEETIAKYRDIDASLKRLEMKLREGSTLETGLRGQNKVSNLASQLSSKWERKETEKIPITRQPSRPMVPLPTSGSDLCHFCGNRVYLVERLSAEGKFFHRQCFKCDYCAANLRLGNYIYDREGTYGGKFFCIPHFGLTSRARGVRRKVEDTDSAKENIVPPVASSTPQPKVQMRNGPQTWPINGHGSIDWMQQCDGEMSPRQYTALIRRASSLHYRPKHFLNHHSGGSDLTDKTSDREIILKTDQTCASRDKSSLLGIRCLDRQSSFRDNYSRVLASSVSFMPISIEENSKFPHGRNCRLSQSFRLPNSTALVKQFSNMNINSQNHHKGDSEPKLYVKLSSSTHLSESNDFQTQESSDPKYSAKDISNKEVKLRKCKAVMNLQLTRETDNFSPENIATGSVSGPQTMQLDTLHKTTSAKTLIPLLSSPSSVKSRSLTCLPSSPTGALSSPTIHPSSPTYFKSIPTDLPSPSSPLPSPKANLSPLLSVMSLTHYHPTSSPSVTSSVQPLFLSPSDIKAQPKHLYERPYYDCGYDTDYDSTPPHSSPECDDGKLKAIDSSQVWSRYLAWLHRMTKTQS